MSKERLTQRQRDILNILSKPTAELVGNWLMTNELPFDFRSVEYELTGDFQSSRVKSNSLRRTLRMMESKGQLVRGSMRMDVNPCGKQEMFRPVATWHNPLFFQRDKKFLQALEQLDTVKRQPVTTSTPPHLIKKTMIMDMVDSSFLEDCVVNWLDGITQSIVLPGWVTLPVTELCSTQNQLLIETELI